MVDLHRTSIDVIRAGQAASGAYVASPTFSQYGYSWLRDGTWIAYAMAHSGQRDSADAFHRWAYGTLSGYQAHVERLLAKLADGETPAETDYLPTRFRLDGGRGNEAWPDFQLDGYGAWLWGLAQHCGDRQDDLWREARPAVQLLVRYLAALWSSPNYDCWEEFRDHIHTATLAALYGGLRAVQVIDPEIMPDELPEAIRAFALRECVSPAGRFVKFIGNDSVDASLLWVALPYGLVNVTDPRFLATLAKIERGVYRPGGGVYRYAADTYYGGGEWPLLAAWLGWAYVELGRVDRARQLMAWIAAQASPSGELPEQASDHLLNAGYYPQWVARWGAPARPLLWSHAMYLVLESLLKERTHG